MAFPVFASAQTFTGTYRSVIFNMLSGDGAVIAEFEVSADNSIKARVKSGDSIFVLVGKVEKNGKFEASSEPEGEVVYKLRGRFDKNNKIAFIKRRQIGSGLNKSVSENSLEGTFSSFRAVPVTSPQPKPKAELIDNGKSWIRVAHENMLFGPEWSGFSAQIIFGSSAKGTVNTSDPADYFILSLRSDDEDRQILRLNVRSYTADKKLWKGNEFRTASYRENNGEKQNSFVAGEVMRTDPFYADSTLEIVRETESQIVFKISDFKIKRFPSGGFVELNGYVYADKNKP